MLAHPTSINNLTLDAILQHLYQPKTIKITEQFKVFKRNQLENKSVAKFMAELRTLAKTCNFDAYLESTIRDQFVCGLQVSKSQQTLLCEEGEGHCNKPK